MKIDDPQTSNPAGTFFLDDTQVYASFAQNTVGSLASVRDIQSYGSVLSLFNVEAMGSFNPPTIQEVHGFATLLAWRHTIRTNLFEANTYVMQYESVLEVTSDDSDSQLSVIIDLPSIQYTTRSGYACMGDIDIASYGSPGRWSYTYMAYITGQLLSGYPINVYGIGINMQTTNALATQMIKIAGSALVTLYN